MYRGRKAAPEGTEKAFFWIEQFDLFFLNPFSSIPLKLLEGLQY